MNDYLNDFSFDWKYENINWNVLCKEIIPNIIIVINYI